MDFNQIFHLEASGLRSRPSTAFSGTDVSSDDDNCAAPATAMSRKNNSHSSGKESNSKSSSGKFLENSNNNSVNTSSAKQKTTPPAKHHSAHPGINNGLQSSEDDEDLQTNSYNLLRWSNRLELESTDLKDQTAIFLQKLEKLVERLESSNVNHNILPPSPALTQPPQPQAVNGKTSFQANSNYCNDPADLRKDMQQIKKSLEGFQSVINENIANNIKHQNAVAPIHLSNQDNGPLIEKLNELQRKHSQNICKDIMNKSKDFHYKQRKKIRDEKLEFESNLCKRLDKLESNQQMILELLQLNKSNSNNDRQAHEPPPPPPQTITHSPLPPSSCIQSTDSAAAHNLMPKNDNPRKRKNVTIKNRTTNLTTTTKAKRPRATKADVSEEDSFTAYTLSNDFAGTGSRASTIPAAYADNVENKKGEPVTLVDKFPKQITPRSGMKFSKTTANLDFGKPYRSSVPPQLQTSSPQLSIYASKNNTIANSYTLRDFPTTNEKEGDASREADSSFTSSLQTLNATNADDVNQKLVSPNELDTQDYENTLLSIISDD